jgi:hypothetical protein
MQRQSFGKLCERLISFPRAALERVSKHLATTEASASPTLVFTAITLLLILSIIQIDMLRDELSALGLVFRDEVTEPNLLGP